MEKLPIGIGWIKERTLTSGVSIPLVLQIILRTTEKMGYKSQRKLTAIKADNKRRKYHEYN